jgi:hypothetical protein
MSEARRPSVADLASQPEIRERPQPERRALPAAQQQPVPPSGKRGSGAVN